MTSATSHRLRWVLYPLCTVVVLTLVAAGLGYHQITRAFPQTEGELTLPALDEDVTVHRDNHGIPRIYAETADDLFRAQGFVHAQDRFWQMHINRMTTSGRLAELFGEEQLETDVYLRTMGWRHVAEREYDLLDADTRTYLDAYAEGVNAYLDQRDGGQLGLEFTALGILNSEHGVQAWTPVDSLAWLKAMAWDLRGNMAAEVDRASLVAAGYTRAEVEELYPEIPEDHPPILAGGDLADGEFVDAASPLAHDTPPADNTTTPAGGSAAGDSADNSTHHPTIPPEAAPALDALADGLHAVPELLGPNNTGLGSNSWVVSGEHTASGAPILANDPHLGASMPSVWHQSGLHCAEVNSECPFDLVGFGFPGLPGTVIGQNADIAWGFTNLGPDVTDLYLEQVDNEANTVLVDDQYEPLDTRTETITVADAEDVEITVRSSRNGPLLSDAAEAEDLRTIGERSAVDTEGSITEEAHNTDYAVALRWTALEPGTTADAIFDMGAATDFDSFREAARSFDVPAQNLIYADTEGTIGYQAPGRIPERGSGDGRWPAPGWDSDYVWQGYLDFDELPTIENPDSGVIVTANQPAVDEDYPHLLTDDWDYGYRAARIHELLTAELADSADGGVTVADMLEIMMDAEHGGAQAVVEYLLDVPLEEELDGANETTAEAQQLLADWDFQQDVDSAGAAFYNATWNHLLDVVFAELPEDHRMPGGSRSWVLVTELLRDPDASWWDGPEHSSRAEALALAMDRASAELTEELGENPGQWRWGELHTFTPVHTPFGESGTAALEWLFNGSTVEAPGGISTVNATGWDRTEGYHVETVPSMRMAVDLADRDSGRWVDLTGVSGHVFHPNRQDQTELWAEGETLAMPFTPDAVRDAATETLTLRP
ncbi:penicillin acylase family protein [Lipingzhangella sp. LS1_29]|uniref:Penicillin acylase family protein n=1 Tax=Lipingzhangella rawalii TaxID=2055835 RepID=A0ABU2H6I3_9ACTN|nr:penicillin acylase family protein [Lipingzhangella rawalii]MDS1270888.1 penicillin acylase family protein [Lipingzhangella rawalii]